MRIAAFQRRRWPDAVRAAGHECVTLPPPPNCAYFESTLADLIAHGRMVREILEREPVDFIIDAHGDGMLFVSDPRDHGADALLHHHLRVPLVSHFSETLRILFRKFDPALLHDMLQSPTWHKGIFVKAHAAEMRWFGIPNCLHLPLAADDRAYPAEPPAIDPEGPLVFFAGSQQSRYFAHDDGADTRTQRAGAMALAAVADGSADTFLDVYRRFDIGPEPAGCCDPAERAGAVETYYRHKLFFSAARNLATRDRFVLRLQRELGDRFLLVGDERWKTMYDLPVAPRLDDDAYRRAIRQTPLSLNMVNGDNDTGLNLRPFEITAWGGMLLHYSQPELAEMFEPGVECIAFESENELLDKVRYYAGHEAQRNAIAAAGRDRTMRTHLLHHRLETVIAHLREEGQI